MLDRLDGLSSISPSQVSRSELAKELYWLSVSPVGGGVYVLIEKGRVAYVGKTRDVLHRFNTHHAISRRQFRRTARCERGYGLYFLHCDEPIRGHIEAFLIYVFRPPMNSVQPGIEYHHEHEELYDTLIGELKGFCNDHNV